MKKILSVYQRYFSAIFLINLLLVSPVLAHPGRTDGYGCHTCRTNCTKWGLSQGEYHCHRAKELPQPKEPIKSHYSETKGYTTPAPEYKINQPVKKDAEAKSAPVKEIVAPPAKTEKKESLIKRVYNFFF